MNGKKPPESRGQVEFPPSSWRRDWLFGFLLVAAIIAAYQSVWNAGTIWDDDRYITEPKLRSLNGLVSIWAQPGVAMHQYYPLVYSVFWVEHKLWGDATIGYHWVNILLHAFSALLLVKILRQLQLPGAWLAAALFALHPVEVESVAWISELKNTLSGVFYLSAALAYLGFDQNRNRGNYVMALGLFLLGLMSKTVIASLPAALLVVFWWQRGKLSWKRDALPLIPFFILGIGAGLFTAWVERKIIGAEGAEFNFSFVERLLIAGRVIWFYLGKLVWPVDLVFIYPHWDVNQTVWWQYLFPAAVLLLVAVLVWRRWRGALAGLLFFMATLFPALGFFNVYPFRYSFVADHFQYLASLGPLTLIAAGITAAAGFFQGRKSFLGPMMCAAVLLVLGTLTWRQCGMYVDAETLWRATIERNPGSFLAQNNLGTILREEGKADEAIIHFQEALKIKPDGAEIHLNLGNIFFDRDRLDEALAQYQKALEIDPNNVEARNYCGRVLLHLGRVDEAITHFQAALRIEPDNAKTHNNLGNALAQKGKASEAIAHFQEALRIEPDGVGIQNNFAWFLATCPEAPFRNGDKAVELAQQANRLTGGENPLMLQTLAAAFAEAGRFSEAMETARQALRLAEAQSNTNLSGKLQREMEFYQTGKPYHIPKEKR